MGENQIADVLERAADRLSKPRAWIQGDLGHDRRGYAVETSSIKTAVCFCAAGAIWRESPDEDTPLAVFDFLRPSIGGGGLGAWNDAPERTQEEVVQTLREAAAKARGTS